MNNGINEYDFLTALDDSRGVTKMELFWLGLFLLLVSVLCGVRGSHVVLKKLGATEQVQTLCRQSFALYLILRKLY